MNEFQPISAVPAGEVDTIGTVSFSQPTTAPCGACVEPQVNPVPAPEAPPAPAPIISVYPSSSVKVRSASEAEDEMLIELSFDVSVSNPSSVGGATIFKNGTVNKTLKVSKSKLAQEMLASLDAPISVVEQATKPVIEAKNTEKTTAQRMRELAGISGKGTWV